MSIQLYEWLKKQSEYFFSLTLLDRACLAGAALYRKELAKLLVSSKNFSFKNNLIFLKIVDNTIQSCSEIEKIKTALFTISIRANQVVLKAPLCPEIYAFYPVESIFDKRSNPILFFSESPKIPNAAVIKIPKNFRVGCIQDLFDAPITLVLPNDTNISIYTVDEKSYGFVEL